MNDRLTFTSQFFTYQLCDLGQSAPPLWAYLVPSKMTGCGWMNNSSGSVPLGQSDFIFNAGGRLGSSQSKGH